MDFGFDISPWLISSMISDLNQTANFTSRGYREANPLAKPFVEPKSSYGEVGLGFLGSLIASQLPEGKKFDLLKLLWASGHTLAGIHNMKQGYEKPNIIFPVLTMKW